MTQRSRFSGNTAFGLLGVGLFITSLVAGPFLSKNTDQRAALALGLVGFGLACLTIGVGQLVTGHVWQNLADRNEGEHRDQNPKRFWMSVALDIAVFFVACVFAFYKYYGR